MHHTSAKAYSQLLGKAWLTTFPFLISYSRGMNSWSSQNSTCFFCLLTRWTQPATYKPLGCDSCTRDTKRKDLEFSVNVKVTLKPCDKACDNRGEPVKQKGSPSSACSWIPLPCSGPACGMPSVQAVPDRHRRRTWVEEKKANIVKGGQQECATLMCNRHRICNLQEPEMMECNRFMTPLFLVCNPQILVFGGPHGLQGGGKHLRYWVAKIKKWFFDGIRQNRRFHEVVEVQKPRVPNFSKFFIFWRRGCTYGAVDKGICDSDGMDDKIQNPFCRIRASVGFACPNRLPQLRKVSGDTSKVVMRA